jgi:hypothetical protein
LHKKDDAAVQRDTNVLLSLHGTHRLHLFIRRSLIGGGSEADIALYLKYYADEDERPRWIQEWPDDQLPDREPPPYDRDRRLPRPPWF